MSLAERIDKLTVDQLRRSLIALGKRGLIGTKNEMRKRLKILCGEPL